MWQDSRAPGASREVRPASHFVCERKQVYRDARWDGLTQPVPQGSHSLYPEVPIIFQRLGQGIPCLRAGTLSLTSSQIWKASSASCECSSTVGHGPGFLATTVLTAT